MTYKKISLLLFVPFLLTISSKLKAQDFEGVIYYEIPEMAKEGIKEMPYMVKGSKVRIESADGPNKAAMLFVPEESKIVILIDKLKGYMTMDYSEDEFLSNSEEGSKKMNVTNTGETKTVANRTCEVWIMKSAEGSYETCVSKELGTFMMPKHISFRKNSPEWAKQIAKGGFMPLEVLEIDENGQKTLMMRAIRIEEKVLDPSLFEIPQDYKDMSNLMKGMMDRYKS